MQKNNKLSDELQKATRLLAFWYVRVVLLGLAALCGLWLAKHGGFLLVKLHLINLTIASNKQLAILLMSLPVLFVLWLFRTYDTREQIQKTQENADATLKSVKMAQKSLNANTLTRNMNMLFSDDLRDRCLGLIQLAEIKRQGHFVNEIENATRQNIKLNGAIFREENLSGVNLERAELVGAVFSEGTDLSGVNLQNTNMHNVTLCGVVLKGANLQGACLTEADFKDADLENADLRGADLSTAKNLEHANLMGAKYNDGTKFPEAFGRFRWEQENKAKSMGMIYVP